MNNQPISVQRTYKKIMWGLAGVALIYLAFNLFMIGGDRFIYQLNQFIPIPFALVNVIMAGWLFRDVGRKGSSAWLWGGITLGWTFWFLAELIWFSPVFTGQEISYPSLADIFWVLGYVPMGIGLGIRLSSLPARLGTTGRSILWLLTIVLILVLLYLFVWPLLLKFDPADVLVSVLNVFYPLADLILLLIAVRLLLVFQKGSYGRSWLVLSIGFVLLVMGDLLFSFASNANIYYPDGIATLFSRLAVDAPYSLAYLVWIFALSTLHLFLKAHRPFLIEVQLQAAPNAHLVLFLGWDNVVNEVSTNFQQVCGSFDPRGKSLDKAVNMTPESAAEISVILRRDQQLSDFPVSITNQAGESQPAWINGLALMDPGHNYKGAVICLRTVVRDASADDQLSGYIKSIMRHVHEKTGNGEDAQVRQLILDYYQAHFKTLYNITFEVGGAVAGQLYWDHLASVAVENGWSFHYDGQTIETDSSLPVLRKMLPGLRQSASEFASQYTTESDVIGRIKALDDRIDPIVLANVAHHLKTGL